MDINVHGICHSQTENLHLVRNRMIVNVSQLPDAKETTEFYMQYGVPEERAKQISQCFEIKKDMLLEFQNANTN